MAEYICKLSGSRGREMEVYDNKVIIRTKVTAGSLITGNATDGEKTIFYKDCVGVQYKRAGVALGYIQLETPSMQMNNQQSNFFSENTFTFDQGLVPNPLASEVYAYISHRMEGYKYGFDQDESYYKPTQYMEKCLQIVGKAIFFCKKCKGTFAGEVGKEPNCPNCGEPLLETTISQDKWRTLSHDEKSDYRYEWSQ